jgi:hypothetical protein
MCRHGTGALGWTATPTVAVGFAWFGLFFFTSSVPVGSEAPAVHRCPPKDVRDEVLLLLLPPPLLSPSCSVAICASA